MRTIASEYMQHTSDACHNLTLCLLYYMCGVQVQYTCIDNEMHWFCSWAASNSIFDTDEIYDRVLIKKNVKKCMYNVKTRMKLNSYTVTHSLNHISDFIC